MNYAKIIVISLRPLRVFSLRSLRLQLFFLTQKTQSFRRERKVFAELQLGCVMRTIILI